MNTDGHLDYWSAMEPSQPQPTLNCCPLMRRVWALMAGREE